MEGAFWTQLHLSLCSAFDLVTDSVFASCIVSELGLYLFYLLQFLRQSVYFVFY